MTGVTTNLIEISFQVGFEFDDLCIQLADNTIVSARRVRVRDACMNIIGEQYEDLATGAVISGTPVDCPCEV